MIYAVSKDNFEEEGLEKIDNGMEKAIKLSIKGGLETPIKSSGGWQNMTIHRDRDRPSWIEFM